MSPNKGISKSIYEILPPHQIPAPNTQSKHTISFFFFVEYFLPLHLYGYLACTFIHFYISAWKGDIFPIWACIAVVKFPFFLWVHTHFITFDAREKLRDMRPESSRESDLRAIDTRDILVRERGQESENFI